MTKTDKPITMAGHTMTQSDVILEHNAILEYCADIQILAKP